MNSTGTREAASFAGKDSDLTGAAARLTGYAGAASSTGRFHT